MRRYYLHMNHLTGLILDREGSEHDHIDAVIEEAHEGIRHQVADDIRGNRQLTLWSIRICDGNGNLLREVFTSETISDIVAVAFLDVPSLDGTPT
ncbi:DUF6894 family protein [Rhizobium wenxiniae]|uniref:DUF6894 family protein n=1 Tax=Rhizobium wenxiniae TaxID=1737357 RepID=UPI003C2BB5C3